MSRRKPVALAALALVLTGCAAGANSEVGTAAAAGAPAGFWLGLWHGLIIWISFVISLFTPDVSVYEVHNTGNSYDAGFFLGILMAMGGGAHGSAAARRRRR